MFAAFWNITSTENNLTVSWEAVHHPLLAQAYKVTLISSTQNITKSTTNSSVTFQYPVFNPRDFYKIDVKLLPRLGKSKPYFVALYDKSE